MFRYQFVPLAELHDGRIAVALADPSQLMSVDEISLLLGKRLVVRVTTAAQIRAVLNKVQKSPSRGEDPEDPLGPSSPAAPVLAPLKPRPYSLLTAAKAVPEQEQ
jgi:Type II secretion system (T2SS), protein E, N-terminal domain